MARKALERVIIKKLIDKKEILAIYYANLVPKFLLFLQPEEIPDLKSKNQAFYYRVQKIIKGNAT